MGRYKRPLASRDFIGLWKEKRYRQNMMFLFAGHSDKPLKSLISMAHKGNHICLYRFSFIYAVNDLWEDAYICPIYTVNRTTESAIYVMELTEFHLWVLPLVLWIDGFSQPEYCILHSLGLIKNRTDLFSGFWERPVLRKQTSKDNVIGFWNHDGYFLSTAASDNKRKRSWKQTVLFFVL